MLRRESEFSRRTFLQLAAAGTVGAETILRAGAVTAAAGASGTPTLRVEMDATRALVSVLSWDTEGGDRVRSNLLRAPLSPRMRVKGEWRAASDLPSTREADGKEGTRYRISVAPDGELLWGIHPAADRLSMTLAGQGAGMGWVEGLQMVFPFDPGVTPTTVLPSEWDEDGSLRLPAVISAPDFGQMLLAESAQRPLKARLEGNREQHTVEFIVELPALAAGETCRLELTPVYLRPPEGMQDEALWRAARRGWFNAWQPSARWGEQGQPFSAPAGVLANNVISDPCSISIMYYADPVLWAPEVAPGISVAARVRSTVDWWLDNRTRVNDEVICYWDYGNFLGANAAPVIAAWDYVEATGDTEWLLRPRRAPFSTHNDTNPGANNGLNSSRIRQLEYISDFLVRRDVDNDGLVEATQSGNRGKLINPDRSTGWFDAINCGHKDGYSNAVIYRAWRCLADLEARLHRPEQQMRYTQFADRLKAAFAKTLYNPETGWLAWWKSEDGELHDYATPLVNGMAIQYGLVEPAEARKILARLWEKIAAVGFTRFDLGVPPMLVPVRRSDYCLPDLFTNGDIYGCPKQEDGRDTLGLYQNGGITAGHVLHFLAAHYVVGEPEKADMVLRAMLGRLAQGGFQNGVRNKMGEGIDWTTWDGKPSGYEGYLADNYQFLLAVLLREPSFRARYYRPLAGPQRARA